MYYLYSTFPHPEQSSLHEIQNTKSHGHGKKKKAELKFCVVASGTWLDYDSVKCASLFVSLQ